VPLKVFVALETKASRVFVPKTAHAIEDGMYATSSTGSTMFIVATLPQAEVRDGSQVCRGVAERNHLDPVQDIGEESFDISLKVVGKLEAPNRDKATFDTFWSHHQKLRAACHCQGKCRSCYRRERPEEVYLTELRGVWIRWIRRFRSTNALATRALTCVERDM
jgi:hypothetical protein